MAIKFGVKEIRQPSPSRFKFIVNLLIIVVLPTFSGVSLLASAYGYIDKEFAGFLAELVIIFIGALKGLEKLSGDTSHPEYVEPDLTKEP